MSFHWYKFNVNFIFTIVGFRKYLFQGASSPEPSTVYVDLRALRNDRVSLVERGSPHSLCVMESGKLLPGVKVIIANPETKGQCGDSHLGEVSSSQVVPDFVATILLPPNPLLMH